MSIFDEDNPKLTSATDSAMKPPPFQQDEFTNDAQYSHATQDSEAISSAEPNNTDPYSAELTEQSNEPAYPAEQAFFN